MAVRYVSCPECDRSFRLKDCPDGTLPAHTFCGKPCEGSGKDAQP